MNKPQRNRKMTGVKNLNMEVSFNVQNDEERKQLTEHLFPPKKYHLAYQLYSTYRMESK
jgi:hypothetical protein